MRSMDDRAELRRQDTPDEVKVLERRLDSQRRQQVHAQHELRVQEERNQLLQHELLKQQAEKTTALQKVYKQSEMAMPVIAAEAYVTLSSHQNEAQAYLTVAKTLRSALERIKEDRSSPSSRFAERILQVKL